MWHYLWGTRLLSGKVEWQLSQSAPPGELSDEEGLEIRLDGFPRHVDSAQSAQKVRDAINRILQTNNIEWLSATDGGWQIDLDRLIEFEGELETLPWLRGRTSVSPHFVPSSQTPDGDVLKAFIRLVLTEESVRRGAAADAREGERSVIFYSWQSDLPNSTNRGFIEQCLNAAIKKLQKEHQTKVVALERDTQGVGGSPDIAATIFGKIDESVAFIGDVSIINKPRKLWQRVLRVLSYYRLTPNPNVLLELGYAAKALDWSNYLCIANTYYGDIGELPFDLRKRRVLGYYLAPRQDKSQVRQQLVSDLVRELRKCLATTDPESPATVGVVFGDEANQRPLGDRISIRATRLNGVDSREIPDYEIAGVDLPPHLKQVQAIVRASTSHLEANPDYYRRKAEHLWLKSLLRPIVFGVNNTGSSLLTGVHLKIEIPKSAGIIVMEDVPELPWKERNRFDMSAAFPRLPRNHLRATELVADLQDRFVISVACGRVRPDDWSWSDRIFIGSVTSQTFEVSGKVFNDQGPPRTVSLTIDFETIEEKWTLETIETPLPEELEAED